MEDLTDPQNSSSYSQEPVGGGVDEGGCAILL